MRKKYALTLIIMIALVAFVVRLFSAQNATQTSDQIEKLSIGIVGDTSSLVLLAQKQGFFEQRGLAVEIKQYGNGAGAVDDLLLGNVDVAVGSEYVGVVHSFGSSDFKMLAAIAKTSAYEIVARADHGISQPSDLAGKKIGTTSGTAGEYWLDVFLTSNMLSRKDIEFVNMRPQELTEAFITGSIDAVLNLEPHTQNAKNTLFGKTVSFRGQRGQGVYSVLYASQEAVNFKPNTLNTLIESLIDAEEFFTKNPEVANNFIAEYFEYSPEYMQEVVAQKYDFGISLEQALLLTMEDEARWMINKKLVDAAETPNYLKYLYAHPLQLANPDVVTVIYK